MSFAAPGGEEPPIVIDFGAVHDLYDGEPHVRAIEMLAPSATYRSIGLGSFCQILGGFLCGVPSAPERAQAGMAGANQGSFMTAHDVNHYMPLDQFQARGGRLHPPSTGARADYQPVGGGSRRRHGGQTRTPVA